MKIEIYSPLEQAGERRSDRSSRWRLEIDEFPGIAMVEIPWPRPF